ncbi:hypothetical protein NDNC_0800 [Candidatus Nasuia deltocephalinicola]|nr:hypothetical protein NDNC_0800 [Candidatus Nasuia deltocephalinicola]
MPLKPKKCIGKKEKFKKIKENQKCNFDKNSLYLILNNKGDQ